MNQKSETYFVSDKVKDGDIELHDIAVSPALKFQLQLKPKSQLSFRDFMHLLMENIQSER